jgi:hypothetical protein
MPFIKNRKGAIIQIEEGEENTVSGEDFIRDALGRLGVIDTAAGVESRRGRDPTVIDIEKGTPRNSQGGIDIPLNQVIFPETDSRGKQYPKAGQYDHETQRLLNEKRRNGNFGRERR